MRFYRGATTGTATAGGSNTITIAAGTGNAQHRGLKIFLVSGIGAAQGGRITGVSGDVYTISCSWDTAPVAGTGYMIADTERLIEGPESQFRLEGKSPGTMLLYWDFIEHTLRFWPPLDDAGQYALEVDGLVDLSLVDRTDARMVRLLREWRQPLVRGLMVRMKEDQDDPDSDKDEAKFERSVSKSMRVDANKRLRAEGPAMRSIGGAVRKGRY
jgi:hypothetical protein